MKTKTISEICLVNPRMPTSLALQKDRDVDFVPMANVGEDGRITVNGSRKLHEVQKGYTYFQNGDVIVAKITPCMENGKAAYVRDLPNDVGFGSTEFHVLRPQDGVDPAYLFHMIWSPFFRREAARNMTGTAGQQRVPTTFFDRFKIPLPPLSEQRRIADILDKADGIRRKRQEVNKLLPSLPTSFFEQLFGDPVQNPLKLKTVPLGEVLSLQGGFAFKSTDYCDAGIPLIRIGNANNLDFRASSLIYLPARFLETYSRFVLTPGDMIITLTGTVGKDDYAKLVKVPSMFDRWLLNQRVARVRITDTRITEDYLIHFLMHPRVKRLIRKMDRGVRQANLSNEDILTQQIPLPPQETQKRFSEVVSRTGKIQATLKTSLNEEECLFNSLVQRAFRGEL
jgi:type I restriction enzyme S subunit